MHDDRLREATVLADALTQVLALLADRTPWDEWVREVLQEAMDQRLDRSESIERSQEGPAPAMAQPGLSGEGVEVDGAGEAVFAPCRDCP